MLRGAAFDGLFRADAFSAFAKVLIYLASAVAIVMASGFFERTSGDDLRPEYPVLILLSTAGAGMMVSAGDLLTLYVGLELQSLSSYVLASFMRRDTRSAEAGLKYFVLGALASGILLYGISLVYGFSGTTLFTGIADAYSVPRAELSTGLLFGLSSSPRSPRSHWARWRRSGRPTSSGCSPIHRSTILASR